MMEFPLFPVFLCAAVQTPAVPRGWAGAGRSEAVYPSSTWSAREGAEHSDTWRVAAPRGENGLRSVCLALLHLPLFWVCSHLCPSPPRNQFMLGFSQMAGPLNSARTADPTSVRWSLQWSSMTAHRRPIFYTSCTFMAPTSLGFLHNFRVMLLSTLYSTGTTL